MEGGKIGGMARVATLKKQLAAKNTNTVAVLAGDFLNPSVIGTLEHEGTQIQGAQMVDVMNACGIDWVTFGNHEFDLKYEDLLKRLKESAFGWTCANTFEVVEGGKKAFAYGSAQKPVSKHEVLTFKDADGTSVKIGLFGVCLPFNQPKYVSYTDPLKTAKEEVQMLKNQSDVIIGLTHLNIGDDKLLAQQNPEIALIMGGHEHENSYNVVGKTFIAKADANVKTAYVHHVTYYTQKKKVEIKSELIKITDELAEDAATKQVVDKWNKIADAAFKKNGFSPNEVVCTLTEPLNGMETSIRVEQNNLGASISKAMAAVAKQPVDCAFFNGGSVRVDDMLKDKLTQYDVIRTLPYGGDLWEVDMKGSLLDSVLTIGRLTNKGSGGYLQRHNASFNEKTNVWEIKGKPLDKNQTYHIITNSFLMKGREKNLGFLTADNKGVLKVDKPNKEDAADLRNDIRKAWIADLKGK